MLHKTCTNKRKAERFLTKVRRELAEHRILRPVFVAPGASHALAAHLAEEFVEAHVMAPGEVNAMGRDIILVHSGDWGWSELIAEVCSQCPNRFFVVTPECPPGEAFKLHWVADHAIVASETDRYVAPETYVAV